MIRKNQTKSAEFGRSWVYTAVTFLDLSHIFKIWAAGIFIFILAISTIVFINIYKKKRAGKILG